MRKLLILLGMFSFLATMGQSETSTRSSRPGAPAPADSTQNNYALVVGISSYPNINRLLYADDDAHLFADYLVEQKICDKKNVVKLIDSVATEANFYKELKKLMTKAGKNDRVFIYFAGHGDVETEIESGFLLCYNSESSNYPATDAIDISLLEKFVGAFVNKNVSVVLITDACRSGNLAGGLAGASGTFNSISNGFQKVIKMLSCQQDQLSEEKAYYGGGHGVFTYHLVEGMYGLADKNDDGTVSLRELDLYLELVSDATQQKQIPKLEGNPQARLVQYDRELMKQALAKKSRAGQDVAMRTRNRAVASAWNDNAYYTRFNHYIRKEQFVYPEKYSAFRVLKEAESAGQPAELVQDMKLELSAVLEDECQKWINKYLRGEFENDQIANTHMSALLKKYADVLVELNSDDEFRRKDFLVKKTFFKVFDGVKYSKDIQLAELIAELEAADKIIPNQAWLLHLQAILYGKSGQFHVAEDREMKALRLAPNWADAWNSMGLIHFQLMRYDEAEEHFKQALKIDPTYFRAWYNLVQLYRYQQRTEEVSILFDNISTLEIANTHRWYSLAGFYAREKMYEQADACLEKYLLAHPGSYDGWLLRADNFKNWKKMDEAEVAFRKGFLMMSEALIKFGNYSSAESVLGFHKGFNQDPQALILRTRLYSLWGKQEQALQALGEALKYGYNDWDRLQTDEDFILINQTSEFRLLLDHHRK